MSLKIKLSFSDIVKMLLFKKTIKIKSQFNNKVYYIQRGKRTHICNVQEYL
jgi:hypothetical protein